MLQFVPAQQFVEAAEGEGWDGFLKHFAYLYLLPEYSEAEVDLDVFFLLAADEAFKLPHFFILCLD